MPCAYNKEEWGNMVWGCLSWYGLGPLIPIHRKLNADSYYTLLDNNVLPRLRIKKVAKHRFSRIRDSSRHPPAI
ncbi:hypothetical protein TNCV_420961 [Trichonephila clavipes]|nr:hypothetical protein TNCV_420961 [Trichonephila clavipes]